MADVVLSYDKVRKQYPAVVDELRLVLPRAAELLPLDIPAEQFRASLWLELRETDLSDCSAKSIISCVIRAATHGFLLGRDAHLLPFRSRRGGGKLATLVPNYFGVIRALERTGKVRKAFAHAVYTGDRFQVDYLSDAFHHEPCLDGPRGTLRCFYGCVLLKDGTRHVEVMTTEEVDRIRDRARAQDEGPWTTDFEAMARKTVLKRVAKYVQLTAAQQELFVEEDVREQESPVSEARVRAIIADAYGEAPIPNLLHAPVDAEEAMEVPHVDGDVSLAEEVPQDANLAESRASDGTFMF